ncbi:hypothetical protein N657DRAFT_651499 [Parathielavia appendiculata]|uniref:Uncharacterized protein n=1 Tax=Parathielavia appendiculata TaxID=2587402 RepID=A0AAN6YXY2_9PEZI|nr:hypothetical protein N657DRAFT_651499 [Parathielavia appendiculata]
MTSTQRNSEPSDDNNDNGTQPLEHLEMPHVQDSIELETNTTFRRALSKAAFIVYICIIMAYIFLSAQGPGDEQGHFRIARLVVLVFWMVNSGVLFLCYANYLIRHKVEITLAFIIALLCVLGLVGAGEGAITDGIGVIMVCIVVATLCHGLPGRLGYIGAA